MIQKINFAQAKTLIDTLPALTVLDVREEEEYITGHAINAVLLPVDDITEASAAEVLPDKSTPVLVYCRTGRRSAEAAHKLTLLGYRTVYDMGGLIGWPYGQE
ncbi:MAG: rhodanese-like domain-containing protein [Clostridia bacterium]|nr:rhodanese-like domain-containing protein [Clostridia bacterium]